MDLEEKTLQSRTAFRGRLLRLDVDLISLPNGDEAVREVVHHPGGVCVLPLHPDGTVSVVRQFRYPYKTTLLELPAGKLEPGEDPDEAIRRELAEETGYTAGRWRKMGVFYPSVGYTDEVLHLYLARDLTPGALHLDADEFLEPDRVPLTELVDMALAGNLPDGKTVTLVLMTKALLEQEG